MGLKKILPVKIKVQIIKDGQVLSEGEVEVREPFAILPSLARAYKEAISRIKS